LSVAFLIIMPVNFKRSVTTLYVAVSASHVHISTMNYGYMEPMKFCKYSICILSENSLFTELILWLFIIMLQLCMAIIWTWREEKGETKRCF